MSGGNISTVRSTLVSGITSPSNRIFHNTEYKTQEINEGLLESPRDTVFYVLQAEHGLGGYC